MRRRESGGAVLGLAFALLAPFAAASFLAHRAVAREWALEADAMLGSQASLGADAALAWFLREGWRIQGMGEGVLPVPEPVLDAPRGFHPSGEVRVMRLGPRLWKLTVRSRLQGPGNVPPFLQAREAYVAAEADGAPPCLRAWRILR